MGNGLLLASGLKNSDKIVDFKSHLILTDLTDRSLVSLQPLRPLLRALRAPVLALLFVLTLLLDTKSLLRESASHPDSLSAS